jgi:D-serine deaminase-like pyridoxal phosphate-dependent protein
MLPARRHAQILRELRLQAIISYPPHVKHRGDHDHDHDHGRQE